MKTLQKEVSFFKKKALALEKEGKASAAVAQELEILVEKEKFTGQSNVELKEKAELIQGELSAMRLIQQNLQSEIRAKDEKMEVL